MLTPLLTRRRTEVLQAVRAGHCTTRQLAMRFGRTLAAGSMMLVNLEALGYVTRTKTGKGCRPTWHLTEFGERSLAELRKDTREICDRLRAQYGDPAREFAASMVEEFPPEKGSPP